MNPQKILILNGSPRKKGTSFSFARTIKTLAEETGHSAEIIHVIEYLEEGKKLTDLRKLIAACDILSVVSPLYVDSLPYPVIWFFEELARDFQKELYGKRFFAIGQCAFPYAHLLQPLLGSCKCFAEATKMKWLGGLGYGGGVMLDGAYLETLGKKGQKITLAFKLALDDVWQGKSITPKSQELLTMKIPAMLSWPFAAFLNHNAKKQAQKSGVTDLKRKYYLE